MVVLTHQLTVRFRKQWFSSKEGVGVAQPVLALWLGKSEYGRHRSEEHIPVDDAFQDKTSVLILADDVVSK